MEGFQSKGFNQLPKNKQTIKLKAGQIPKAVDKYYDGKIEAIIVLLFRQIISGLLRILIAVKFLVFKFIGKQTKKIQISFFQVCFLSLFAVVVLKNDFGLRPNDKADNAKWVKEEDKRKKTDTWFSAMLPLWGGSQKIDLDSPSNPFTPLDSDSEDERKTKSYVLKYAKTAIAEMHKFGIPASVKMAQGILESRNGSSLLTTKNRNHFGIKCFSKSCKKGHCSNFGDDHHKDFFRKYKTDWDCWRAHSQMIVSGRYAELLDYGNNYEKWAKGLKKLGYATDRNYDVKLIETIEKFDLHLLDEL